LRKKRPGCHGDGGKPLGVRSRLARYGRRVYSSLFKNASMRERFFSLEGVGEGGGDALDLLIYSTGGRLCWIGDPFSHVARERSF
jgi:hypothetical protein